MLRRSPRDRVRDRRWRTPPLRVRLSGVTEVGRIGRFGREGGGAGPERDGTRPGNPLPCGPKGEPECLTYAEPVLTIIEIPQSR